LIAHVNALARVRRRDEPAHGHSGQRVSSGGRLHDERLARRDAAGCRQLHGGEDRVSGRLQRLAAGRSEARGRRACGDLAARNADGIASGESVAHAELHNDAGGVGAQRARARAQLGHSGGVQQVRAPHASHAEQRVELQRQRVLRVSHDGALEDGGRQPAAVRRDEHHSHGDAAHRGRRRGGVRAIGQIVGDQRDGRRRDAGVEPESDGDLARIRGEERRDLAHLASDDHALRSRVEGHDGQGARCRHLHCCRRALHRDGQRRERQRQVRRVEIGEREAGAGERAERSERVGERSDRLRGGSGHSDRVVHLQHRDGQHGRVDHTAARRQRQRQRAAGAAGEVGQRQRRLAQPSERGGERSGERRR